MTERTPGTGVPGPVSAPDAPQATATGAATTGTTEVGVRGEPVVEVVAVREGMFGVRGTGDTSGYGGLQRAIVMPGAATRPFGGYFDEITDVLAEVLAEQPADGPDGADGADGPGWDAAIEKVVIDRGQLILFVRREHLLRVAQVLRDDEDLRFEMCMGVSGVHYPDETGRELHVVYPMVSITHTRRVRLEVVAPDSDPHVPSITSVYPSNDWHERETWDFFGVVFDGHPALTRIQMPDDWPGHPQRKDYPLGGIPVEYKGATIPPPDTRRRYR